MRVNVNDPGRLKDGGSQVTPTNQLKVAQNRWGGGGGGRPPAPTPAGPTPEQACWSRAALRVGVAVKLIHH